MIDSIATAGKTAGMPGMRGVEHIGFTVPDIEQATRFFVDVLGCKHVYSLPSLADPEGNWMREHLDIHPRAVAESRRLLRGGNRSELEMLQYSTPHQVMTQPRNSDVGGHHLAFYVDDFAAALAYLRAQGVRVLGEPTVRTTGPNAGQTWIYFQAPWGMQLELVSFPGGKGYEAMTTERLWHPAKPAQ
jgi:catechol 2,3-dioxygenase-like lactoylglutathione lyase family enzyme